MLEPYEPTTEDSRLVPPAVTTDLLSANIISFPSPPGRPEISFKSRSSAKNVEDESDLWISAVAAAILLGVLGLLYYALFVVVPAKAKIIPFAW